MYVRKCWEPRAEPSPLGFVSHAQLVEQSCLFTKILWMCGKEEKVVHADVEILCGSRKRFKIKDNNV